MHAVRSNRWNPRYRGRTGPGCSGYSKVAVNGFRRNVWTRVPRVIYRVGGGEAALAARAAAALGAKGTKGLHDLMRKVVPGVRKYIAMALAEASTAGADAAGLKVFLDDDPGVTEAAATALISRIPELSDAKKTSLAAVLVKM